jgi:glycosyltransferase involved in cell wall biosynthesis
MRPLRIDFVAPFGVRRKGTTRARVIPLATALAERGHHVRVLVPSWDSPEDRGGRAWAGRAEILYFPRRGADMSSGPVRLLRELVASIGVRTPDVVHCFKPIGYSGAVALLCQISKRGNRTTPLIAVDCDDLEGRGGWADRVPRRPVESWIRHYQERITLRRADLVTVASQYLVRSVRGWAHSDTRPHYLPNAVPCTVCDVPRPEVCLPQAVELLLYTRFNEFGARRCVSLMAEILRRLPRARLKVVGDTSSQEALEFFAGLRAQHLAERTDNLGVLNGRALSAALTHSTVGLWPFDPTPINRARSPVKLLELMAAGNPIVAENVGEVASLAGRAVRVVSSDRPGAFVAAVTSLVADDAARADLGRAARARARSLHNWDLRAETVETLYYAAHKQGDHAKGTL